MKTELIKFFSIQRQIFGVCTCCGEIFRLSDTKLFLKDKPQADWLDKYHNSEKRLDDQNDKIQASKEEKREKAREKGRLEATEIIERVDSIFTPNNYNADDSKPILHPVDFLIFNGMKQKDLKELILFDEEAKDKSKQALQKSIDKTIEQQNYEWVTIHVGNDGSIEYK